MPIGTHTNPPTFRQVFDYLAGVYSPNSMVSKDDAHIVLDGIGHLAAVARKKRSLLRPGDRLVVWKSDVATAYRCVPVSKHWQPKQVVSFDSKRYVDRCNIWGHRPAGTAWCLFMALALWIAWNLGIIDDPLAFIDDAFGIKFESNMIFYAPYQVLLPAQQANLLCLWDVLGIPHRRPKQVSGLLLVVISLDFDPNELTVSLPIDAQHALLSAKSVCSINKIRFSADFFFLFAHCSDVTFITQQEE